MNLSHLPEPKLRFGLDEHIDVRFGIMNYGVLDYGEPTSPRSITIGIVGTPATIDGVKRWLDRCSMGIEAKQSNQPHLFPRFPGFGSDGAFYSEIIHSTKDTIALSATELSALEREPNIERYVAAASDLFAAKVKILTETPNIRVVLCAPPLEMVERTINDAVGRDMPNFHHQLKAKAMGTRTATQIVLPMTYDPSKKLKRKTVETERRLQDEATRAWNFFTALYYKAGGVPWRLPKSPSDLVTCYVGVTFYRTLDDGDLESSVAQVFDERGEGVIVRGGTAKISKHDKRPYLEAESARALLNAAIDRYKSEHLHFPARVVVHKTSPFRPSEDEGFKAALEDRGIDVWDFVHVSDSKVRLFRTGIYPPLRGTLLEHSDEEATLYTRGSVDFFATYPGMYIPTPALIRRSSSQQSIRGIAEEILALSKLNWNNTQFDGGDPITIHAARRVGDILKHVRADQPLEPQYRFYM